MKQDAELARNGECNRHLVDTVVGLGDEMFAGMVRVEWASLPARRDSKAVGAVSSCI
jgi:hypothetical protein